MASAVAALIATSLKSAPMFCGKAAKNKAAERGENSGATIDLSL
jgi:hypothetical protein